MEQKDSFDRQREIARAAATDAGNRNMRKHGRKKWNEDDYYKASREYNRLFSNLPVWGFPGSGSKQRPQAHKTR